MYLRLALRERAQVEAQANALRQLLQARRVELVRQLGLARDDDAQQLLLLQLEPGEQPYLFEHLARQVLCFVDDEQDLLAGGVLLDHEVLQHREQLDLAHAERLEAELDEQGLQELDGRELRLADVREHDVFRQLGQERLDQRRLAGADVARDDDESVGEPDRRLHVRLGAGVLLAREQELRVRRQAERRLNEFKQLAIHAGSSSPGASNDLGAYPKDRALSRRDRHGWRECRRCRSNFAATAMDGGSAADAGAICGHH
jgi:hypothetical protein